MKNIKMKSSEKDTQRTILEYLALKGIFHYRQNTGAFKDAQGHMYRFGATGSPDIVCVYRGRYVGIEVKGEKGKQSPGQEQFQANLEAAGGLYIVARSLDDVIGFFGKTFKPYPKKCSNCHFIGHIASQCSKDSALRVKIRALKDAGELSIAVAQKLNIPLEKVNKLW